VTSPDWLVHGPLVVAEHCARCAILTDWERFFSSVWGSVMRRCLRCGVEEKDRPIR